MTTTASYAPTMAHSKPGTHCAVKGRRKDHRDKLVNRIIVSWVIIAVVFTVIGTLSGYAIGKEKYKTTTHGRNENTVSGETVDGFDFSTVEVYGSYDPRIITEEVSLDYESDGSFIPITDEMDADLQEFTYYLCSAYNLDFTLVMALIKQESHFDASVVSETNDYGLMQINQLNHQWLTEVLGVTDFTDPYQNIRAGTFILRKLFESYQNTNMVLMAYNMGETGASRLWRNGVYSTSYTEKVLAYQAEYNN